MMPLLTILSMMGVACVRAAAASSCLPAFSARVALRMALLSCEVSASLRARCTVDCRAAFSADFVFAKLETPYETTPHRSSKEPRSLPIGFTLVNDTAEGALQSRHVQSLNQRKPEYNHSLSPWN